MQTTSEERKIRLPRVGVVIPCHNHVNYLEQAIMSVVQQDYPMKAVLFCDDGSTDGSWDKALSLIEDKQDVNKDDQVIFGRIANTMILLKKNDKATGPSAARNVLIKMAWDSSDFFSMLDADDYYLPTKLGKSVAVMAEQPEVIGIVYTDALIYRERQNLFVREYREPYSRERLSQECIISNTPLINKEALKVSGLYDESMRTAEDWDLWLRITQRFVASHIPEALHVYRVTGKNASDVVSPEIWQENWRKIRDRILNGTSN